MQFEALKVFCDVARCRSFSQAAHENAVTQSAVSQVVHQLEKRLGVQLIDRSTRPLQLTDAGRIYYEGCLDLVERYAELEASLRRSQADLAASVRVAAIYSVGLRDMNQYVQRFADLYPHARVHIEYLHPDRVYGEVLGGAADFGLVSFPRKARELAVLPWREEEMVLACPPQHPLARQLAVRPEQIDGQKFVGFERGLAVRREVDRFLHKQGVAVHVALEFDNIENIKKAIEVGAGVALLPEPTLRREVQAGTLVAVPLFGCHFARPLGIIYRRHHKPGTTVQRFIDLLRQPDEEPSAHASPVNGAARGRNGSPRGPRKTS